MFTIGRTTVRKVQEMDLDGMTLRQLMPALDEAARARDHERSPDADEPARLSLHSWLVHHEGLIILIDTGVGNGKSRPQQKLFDHLDNPFLERLADARVSPDEVDAILLTHIHSDHVGWNTRCEHGRWEPTFPRAEVICSDLEWRYGAALANGDEAAVARCRDEAGLGRPVRVPVSGTFADSMRPLEGAVRIRRTTVDGGEVLPGVRFLPTPGHSIDHASLEIVSEGETALFSGDVFHHPLEVRQRDVVSVFCEFPEAARRSRLSFMQRAVETRAMVFSSHFTQSSAGRIDVVDDGFAWRFVEPG